jgi:hypothetical protein
VHFEKGSGDETGSTEGWGTLSVISVTGARIDDASPRLKPGELVRVMFTLMEKCLPVSVRAKVVRETETGFAIEFVGLEPRLKHMIQMAIAQAAPADRGEEDDTGSHSPG